MHDEFATLTHARVRLRQGDYAAARLILTRLLERDPDETQARALLDFLARPGITPAGAASPDRAQNRRRTVRRLENWLARIRRGG